MQIKSITPPVTGWLEIDLDEDIITHLNKLIDQSKIDNISMKDSLAGHISSSLELKDKEDYLMDNLLINCANQFDQAFPSAAKLINHIGTQQRLILNSLWVNFQKKHEFNPMHDHSGVFSFVIWMKIPTDWKEQSKLPFMEGQNHSSVSNFEITYMDTDFTLNQSYYQMSPEMEGKMLFFSSRLKHGVYPFYESDGTRISISGNLMYA
tara:strand:+ start:187 stop:810 length:624 start_codon:yes stop_codon:yes gene_type:complete